MVANIAGNAQREKEKMRKREKERAPDSGPPLSLCLSFSRFLFV